MKVGLLGLMFLIMFTLKLAGPMATISWAVVTAPLWVPLVMFIGGVVMVMIVQAVGSK